MPLRLHYLTALSSFLGEILPPLIERHIDFKLQDSFRIIVPNLESGQDLEEIFLQHERLDKVFIGKSILTLRAFAQLLLTQHPHLQSTSPSLANPTLVLQRKALSLALKDLHPEWNLKATALTSCLHELSELQRFASLQQNTAKSPAFKLAEHYESILEKRCQAWNMKRAHQEAWNRLANRAVDLSAVHEFHFLGFQLPETDLQNCIRALLQQQPAMEIHLYLPLREDMLDPEGKLEKWIKAIESMASSQDESRRTLHENTQIYSCPTAIHEVAQGYAEFCELSEGSLLLAPSTGKLSSRIENYFLPRLSSRAFSSALDSSSSQLISILSSGLFSELKFQEETPISFHDILEKWIPLFQSLKNRLAKNGDFDSLRLLDAYRRRIQEWAQAETIEPEMRSPQAWQLEITEDLLSMRLSAGPLSEKILPLRCIERAGLKSYPRILLLGLNEEFYPSTTRSRFFDEDVSSLQAHEAKLALQHSLSLSQEQSLLSFSNFSLSGRALHPSPLLSDLIERHPVAVNDTLYLNESQKSPYFEDNIHREQARRTQTFNLDSGDLSSLALRPVLLDKLLKHPLSATYLDDYAKCPWRFFARWHLKLKEETTEDLEMHPKNRGTLLHRILENIFSNLIRDFFSKDKIPSLEETQTCLDQVFTKITQEITQSASSIPPVLRENQLSHLHESILALLVAQQENWTEAPNKLFPRHLEWRFKTSVNMGADIPLSGAIDRIDVSADGSHYLLVDYKSSRSAELAKEIREGTSLQLGIYLQAVRQLFLPQATSLGALYWDLKTAKNDQGMAKRELYQGFTHRKLSAASKSFLKEEAYLELEAKLEASVRETLEKILQGDYRLEPKQCLENLCEFREICRYEPGSKI